MTRARKERPDAVAPEVERLSDDPLSDSVERHPAYGLISVSRVSGGIVLYGSDFEHQHFMMIEVHKSELHRGLNRDWPSERGQIVRLYLSEAQWARFVSSPNSGGGAQCTLVHIAGEEPIPAIAEPPKRHEQFKVEMDERLVDLVDELRTLGKKAEDRKLPREIRAHIDSAIRQLTDAMPWVAKQFSEHMEQTTERAKIEINAYLNATISRAGLRALGSDVAPLSLPSAKKNEGDAP